MSPAADKLLADALGLDPEQRADLAAALLDSLDDNRAGDTRPEAEPSAWLSEIERRAQVARTGESPGRPWDQVRDELARKLER